MKNFSLFYREKVRTFLHDVIREKVRTFLQGKPTVYREKLQWFLRGKTTYFFTKNYCNIYC